MLNQWEMWVRARGCHERRRLRIEALPLDIKIAIRILGAKQEELKRKSVERDILVCAQLYLEGELEPGHTVEQWWLEQDRLDMMMQKGRNC